MTDNQEPRSAIFARKVRELRKDHRWSQAEMGRQLSKHGQRLGQSRVATIEDTGSVTIDQAQAFADALGVPIEVLLYEQPPAAEEVHVRQVQRLLRILNIVQGAGEEVNRVTAEIQAELPGRLPRGAVVTATSVIRTPDPAPGE
jgi:transcriptional regulator with XRE-family HTH domain